jgi:hypothetical protein
LKTPYFNRAGAGVNALDPSPRADQLFKLGNAFHRGTGILPVFSGHGQDARATQIGKLIGPDLSPGTPARLYRGRGGEEYQEKPAGPWKNGAVRGKMIAARNKI